MVGQGVVFAIIMLSLVLLVGFAGQVSLAQMTFVGFGAYAAGTWFGGDSVLGLVAGMVLAGAVGALAALPALRLQGLYLALSTLAFAQAASTVFFRRQLGTGGRLPVGRPSVLGLSLRSDRAFFCFVCAVFALVAVLVVAVRASAFGRRLVAMKDSPAACATVGINLTVTKLLVFSLSAAIAGLAGGLLGGLRTQVGTNDFELFQSLAVLLLAYISGIGSVAGALAGGLSFGVLPRLQDLLPSLGNLSFLGPGIGAIGVARNPNGWTSEVGAALRRVRRRPATPEPKAADLSSRAAPTALELARADAAR
jgi:branched-chain amino acid transport system permease protein